MQNARLDELQAGIKIAGRNINNFRYGDDIWNDRLIIAQADRSFIKQAAGSTLLRHGSWLMLKDCPWSHFVVQLLSQV